MTTDAELHEELNALRENSRKMLQDSWRRVEELERQNGELDEEMSELERRVYQLRTGNQSSHHTRMSSSVISGSYHTNTNAGSFYFPAGGIGNALSSRHLSIGGAMSNYQGGSSGPAAWNDSYTSRGDSIGFYSTTRGSSEYGGGGGGTIAARRSMSMQHAGFGETSADRIANEVNYRRRQSIGGGSYYEMQDTSSHVGTAVGDGDSVAYSYYDNHGGDGSGGGGLPRKGSMLSSSGSHHGQPSSSVGRMGRRSSIGGTSAGGHHSEYSDGVSTRHSGGTGGNLSDSGRRSSMVSGTSTNRRQRYQRRSSMESSVFAGSTAAGALPEHYAPPTSLPPPPPQNAQDLAMSVFKMNNNNPAVDGPSQDATSGQQLQKPIEAMTEMERRIHALEQDREEKVDDLKHRIDFEERIATGLREDIEELQEEIQQLHEELEDMETPRTAAEMEDRVRGQAMEILELEAQLEQLEGELEGSDLKDHMNLEYEWDEWEDKLAEVEAANDKYLSSIQHKKQFYMDDIADKSAKMNFLQDGARETIGCLRQDLLSFLNPTQSHELVKDLEDLQEEMIAHEQTLTELLVERMDAKRVLLEQLDQATKDREEAVQLLERLARLALELETMAEASNDNISTSVGPSTSTVSTNTPSTTTNGISVLYHQLRRVMEQLQSGLEARLDLTGQDTYESYEVDTETMDALQTEGRRLVNAMENQWDKLFAKLTAKTATKVASSSTTSGGRRRSLEFINGDRPNKNDSFHHEDGSSASVVIPNRRELAERIQQKEKEIGELEEKLEKDEDEIERLQIELEEEEQEQQQQQQQQHEEQEDPPGESLEERKESTEDLQEECDFLEYGLKEKDGFLETMDEICSEMKASEAELLEELEDLWAHGEIKREGYESAKAGRPLPLSI